MRDSNYYVNGDYKVKFSTTTQYGLMAVGYIAQNSTGPKDTVMAKKIATEYGIGWEYLLKVLQQLVRANVLRSKRGPRGGFTLARPISEISMLDVIEAVEGSMRVNVEIDNQAAAKEVVTSKVMAACREANDKVREIYGKVKFSTLLGD